MKSFSFGRRLATVAAAASLVLLGPAATADAGPAAAEPAAAEPAGARAAGARAVGARAVGARAAGARAVGARAVGARAVGARAAGARAAGARAAGARAAADAGAAPIRVMPLGDSITYGVGSSALDSYRGDLFWRLARAGVPVDYVGSMRSGVSPDPDNEGHKGWTIAQVSARVDDWLATYRPDVILLHIGTNDMVRGNQDAAADLDALLGKIAADAPEAQVFVAKIVGLGNYDDIAAQRFRTYFFNAAIPGLVASRGPNFHLVDDSDVHGIDMWNREHPNDYGYRKMAWNWYRALQPVLNPAGPAWPAADDPYRAATGYHCVQRSSLGADVQGCHLWYQRDHRWQLPVTTKIRYRAKADGRTVTRFRTVTRWVTAA